jgi:motility quorum-sensing regulator/GCU-specific mRNA interferase toxin
MEKHTRTYDLGAIKSAFSSVESLALSTTASSFKGAQELGMSRIDMVKAVQSLKLKDFYKAMTTYDNHKVWQDVYRLKFDGKQIYIKFSVKQNGDFLLLSFKEM